MSILFYCAGDNGDSIFNELKRNLHAHTITKWPDCPDKSQVTTAIVWQPPSDFFDGLSNLQHVLSVAAGVDHLLNHPGLPEHVDVVRLTDAGMAQPMAEFVLYGVLHAQRQMCALNTAQRKQQWQHEFKPLPSDQIHVGILGAGELGLVAAKRLIANHYAVSCWSRSAKQIDNIAHYVGKEGLDEMLPTVNVLVCLLPLTSSTCNIMNAELLAKLPKQAFVINPGRGDHLDEQALLNALDSNHLSGALLDVFKTEPLPQSHAFWTHPRIVVTPHVAAPTHAGGAVVQLVSSVQSLENGVAPKGLVNRSHGY